MWSGQPHPDEGHPPPLEAVPVPWKSVGPCKSHRESLGGLPETPAGEEAQGEEGPAATQLDVSRLRSSSMEIREKGSEFLKEELHKAQKELKLKDEECERLSKVREQLEQELEELTASLFEEAHKMVREANMKQAASEKQLKEARGKIDMLQAEVTALKTLVITSTPASPNRELHPQLLSPTKAGPRKGHLRHKSTSSALCPAVCPVAGHILTPDREGKEPGLPPLLSLLLCVVPSKAAHLTYEPAWQLPPGELPVGLTSATSLSFSRQVDTTLFAEFQAWRESPTLDKTSPFLERVYREDVGPCLDFTMQELSALVRAAVEDNTLTIEPVASQTLPAVKVAAVDCGHTNGFRAPIDTGCRGWSFGIPGLRLTKPSCPTGVSTCALSGLACACRHRIRLGDSESHYYISPSSRARITAVCNFFTYIRYIQQGLVRQDGYESDRCHLQGSQVISTQQFAGPQRGASKRSGHSQRSSVPKDWGVLERSPCSGRSPGCGRRCHWPSSASSPTRPRAWPRPRGRL
ncbi:guanine nucleotide exchange factor for Rab-3A isoform X1 [Bos javanicus]|uniref:guanine nucleotide exchange factor for Rab-3A isoform X1 n=1 Tax=Bos javanicus TaxID=9906 RepID=UPI002AA687ED|nr:guanine nucleotide exchange factor for Rab-3A isoform X1 [Bos javanicus]